MAYPEKLLSPGETVVTEFRPHFQVLITPVLLTLVAIALVVVAVGQLDGIGLLIAIGAVVIAWLVLTARRLVDWWFTHYVITNERVIFRAGIISRRAKEIPLEVINDVEFKQSLFERLVGSGDLVMESAGEFGQSRFTDIPDPEAMQSLIYQVRERRKVSLEGGGRSVAQEIETLARLRDQGVISAAEFDAQKKKLLES
jgi:uncharacterized membrane protein YdbT with pleckstrin-like domain